MIEVSCAGVEGGEAWGDIGEAGITVDVVSEGCVEAWAGGEEHFFLEGVVGLGQSEEGWGRLRVESACFDGEIKFDRSNEAGSVGACLAGVAGEAEDTDSSAGLS